jgi:hypothetical protein
MSFPRSAGVVAGPPLEDSRPQSARRTLECSAKVLPTQCGSSSAENGTINYISSSFMGAVISYGITDKLTAELEAGAFLNKTQDFIDQKYSSEGMSHLILLGKYNVYADKDQELELTLGAGAKIPLNRTTDSLPLHVQPSQRAYGIVSHIFLHKGWKRSELNLYFVNRGEFLFENDLSYQYGAALFTSVFATKAITNNISGILEIRNEYKRKDKNNGITNEDSGNSTIIVAPQLGFSFAGIYAGVSFDIPVFKYFYGHQITNNYSIGVNVSWGDKL